MSVADKYVGMATMEPDGTLVLNMRATGPGGMVGDGQMVVAPDDQNYSDILAHLGGMAPGESKPVPPWPAERGRGP